MKIKYEFLTGETVEVEVDTDIGEIILQIEDETYSGNRQETRRHTSLNILRSKDEALIDRSVDVEGEALRNIDAETLYKAISQLKPAEQDLLHCLYLDMPFMTQAEYAKKLGVKESSISQKAWRVKVKLKRILKDSN